MITGDDGPLELACEAARSKLHAMSGSSTDLTALTDGGERGSGGQKRDQQQGAEEDIDVAVRRVSDK